jgi:hypothetical protein
MVMTMACFPGFLATVLLSSIEGHFPLILSLFLEVKRNYKLSGVPDLQRRKHSIIVLLYKHSLTCSGSLLN